jgi:ferric-dicitrate binding protein FerR (iron transport regulator)
VSRPSRATRRGGLAVLSLALLVAAPLSWWWTIDQPFLRRTGATAWVGIALAITLALISARVDRRRWVRAVALVQLSALGVFAWGFLVVARLPLTTVEAQEKAPDFTLPDSRGHGVTLSEELARGPVLLVFFRGHW